MNKFTLHSCRLFYNYIDYLPTTFERIAHMKMPNEISSVIVPLTHYRTNDVITKEAVAFTISRQNNRFKAIPWLTKEERLQTGLPEKLEFVYYNYCIVEATDMEEETLDAIKQIILELDVQGYFD